MNISSIKKKTLIAFLLALNCENSFGENFPFNSNKKSVIIMSFLFLFLIINVKINASWKFKQLQEIQYS